MIIIHKDQSLATCFYHNLLQDLFLGVYAYIMLSSRICTLKSSKLVSTVVSSACRFYQKKKKIHFYFHHPTFPFFFKFFKNQMSSKRKKESMEFLDNFDVIKAYINLSIK